MVHALEETRRLLKPDGTLVNILPGAEGIAIEVHHEERIPFAERKRDTPSEDVLQAEAAIRHVLDQRLFVTERTIAFDFVTYGSSVPEVRAYWEEQNAYEREPKPKELLAREELLYGQAQGILDKLGTGAEIAIRERVRMARYRPLHE